MSRILLIAVICLGAACDRPAGEPPPVSATAMEPAAATGGARAPAVPPKSPPVAMPAPETLSDAAITRRITTALRGDPAMDGADVSINTDKGVVILSGTVKSHEQTGIASGHAQGQDGVLRVDNHLTPALS